MARYVNIGVSDNLLIQGTVSTNATYSNVGTSVADIWNKNNVAPTVIGLSNSLSEIWIRFDMYYHNGNLSGVFAIFDGLTSKKTGGYVNYTKAALASGETDISLGDYWGYK